MATNATREAVLEEIMSEMTKARTKKARAVWMSLKDHTPRFRPFTIEEMFACTFNGCEAKGKEQVPTHLGLVETGACFAGCRKHRVWTGD